MKDNLKQATAEWMEEWRAMGRKAGRGSRWQAYRAMIARRIRSIRATAQIVNRPGFYYQP